MRPLPEQADTTERHSAADKSGLSPGSLVHIGEKHEAECKISVTQYNVDRLLQHDITSIVELNDLKDNSLITWINIDGLSDTSIVESIGKALNIHALVLEDILSTRQRPKIEEYDDYLYLVVKGIGINRENDFNLQYE